MSTLKLAANSQTISNEILGSFEQNRVRAFRTYPTPRLGISCELRLTMLTERNLIWINNNPPPLTI